MEGGNEDDMALEALINSIATKTEPKDDDDRTPEKVSEDPVPDGEVGKNARKLMREMRMKNDEERKRKEDLENRNRPRRRKKYDMTPEEKERIKEGIISVTHTPTFDYATYLEYFNIYSDHNLIKQAELTAYLEDVERHNGTGTSKKRKSTEEDDYQPR